MKIPYPKHIRLQKTWRRAWAEDYLHALAQGHLEEVATEKANRAWHRRLLREEAHGNKRD